MAGFAADILSIRSFGFESSMRRGAEIARDRFMARRALFRTDEFGARDTGRCEDGVA